MVCQIQIKGADHQIFSIFAKGSVLSLAAQFSPSSFAVLRKDETLVKNAAMQLQSTSAWFRSA